MTISTPLEPPQLAHLYSPPKLTEAQEQKKSQLIAQFSAAEYRVGGDSEKGALSEEEKFWLVSDVKHGDVMLIIDQR